MRVSIVIPTHNRLETLKVALARLQNGTLVPVEVVVVDDGSTTPVSSQITPDDYSFALTILRNGPGIGAPGARNKGLREVNGDLVLLMDDDIWPNPDFVEGHVTVHRRNHAEGFGVFGRVHFDPALKRNPVMHYLEEIGANRWMTKRADGERFDSGLVTANVSLKREFLERVKHDLFDESFPYNRNEDTEFGIRLMAQGLDVRFSNAPTALHHSPLDFEDWKSILKKGGYSKAYWMYQKPDDSHLCLEFPSYCRRHARFSQFLSELAAFESTFKRELSSHWNEIPRGTQEVLMSSLNQVPVWYEGSNIVEGWLAQCQGFQAALETLSRAEGIVLKSGQAEAWEAASKMLPDHIPLAIGASQKLISASKHRQAVALLGDKKGIWVSLFRAKAHLGIGETREAQSLVRAVLESTLPARKSDRLQRIEACTIGAHCGERDLVSSLTDYEVWEARSRLHSDKKLKSCLTENQSKIINTPNSFFPSLNQYNSPEWMLNGLASKARRVLRKFPPTRNLGKKIKSRFM